jgi:hypothetical protein
MIKYIILHNTHNGCYDFQYYEDEKARLRLTSITINPPKIFLFNDREAAQDFFEEYINDVDVIDPKCKKDNDDVEHVNHCTCGIIELDDDENPILFYNKRNQIFLLEQGTQVFMPPQELKNDVKNMNLTNKLIRKCKSLSREQRKRYIELGKYCEDCSAGDFMTDSDIEEEKIKEDKKRREESMKLEYDKRVFEDEKRKFDDEKRRFDETAKLKAEAEAKAKAKAEIEEKIRVEAEAKAKAEAEAKVKAEAEAKVKAEAEAKEKKPRKVRVKKAVPIEEKKE